MGNAILERMDREVWLSGRLKAKAQQHAELAVHEIFQGDTTFEVRRERVRQAILQSGISEEVAGRGKDGKQRTFAQAFEMVYGEPLQVAA